MTSRLALLLLAALPSAHAATFTVTRSDDPAPDGCQTLDCSLREAVNAANAAHGSDRIVLRASTYDLTRIDATPDTRESDRGPLWIDESLELDGAGMTHTVVRWNSPLKFHNPILHTGDGVASLVLRVSDLSLTGGRGDRGGCIVMAGRSSARHRLVFEASRAYRCHARLVAGAVRLYHTDLDLIEAQLLQNSAGYDGGALEVIGASTITSVGALIQENRAERDGGAVRIWGNGFIGPITDVEWIDDGRSLIDYNVAGRDGGAFALHDTASLHLSSTFHVPAGTALMIARNAAGGSGGGFAFMSGLTQSSADNRLEQVTVLGNVAATGGGVFSAVALNVRDAEIAGNRADAGDGGGVALSGAAEWPAGRRFERVALSGNRATLGGGAISSHCGSFSASDLAVFQNEAGAGRGQGIETLGNASLRHATLTGNTHPITPSPALRKSYSTACAATSLRLANSLVADRCAAVVAAQLVSEGGNQFGPEASACAAIAPDQRQSSSAAFGLQIDDFGATFEVPGWPSDGQLRPQRDFGLSLHCSASDVHGRPRSDGACDAGAFEQVDP